MKSQRKPQLLFVLVTMAATFLNILYIANRIPELPFRLGFIGVMLSSIITNINAANLFKRQETHQESETYSNANKVFRWLYVSVMVLWLVTYFIAMFDS